MTYRLIRSLCILKLRKQGDIKYPNNIYIFSQRIPYIQGCPDLYLEVNRLSNPFFYYSRRSIGIDRKSISKYHFVSTCSQSEKSDNLSRIGEK